MAFSMYSPSKDRRKNVILTVFVATLIAANIAAVKVIHIGSWIMPAGTFAFAITFLCTDALAEVWGKEAAKQAVWLGFASLLLVSCYLQFAVWLLPAPFWPAQEAFRTTLTAVPRITFAGMATYVISQLHDVWAFHFWKDKTHGKHLWLRNNASTIISQGLDTVIFSLLAFYGTAPLSVVMQIALGQYVFKVGLALLDTPFCYLLVAWAGGGASYSRYCK